MFIRATARVIAYKTATSSLRRKPESSNCEAFDFRNDTDDLGHWIPAFDGMTVAKLSVCDSPGAKAARVESLGR